MKELKIGYYYLNNILIYFDGTVATETRTMAIVPLEKLQKEGVYAGD